MSLADQLDASMASAPATNMNYFMKLHQVGSDHEGKLTYGPDHIEVHPEHQWVVQVDQLAHGYLEREGGKVYRDAWKSIFEPVEPVNELPELPAGHDYRYAFKLRLAWDDANSFTVEWTGDQQGFIEMVKNTILAAVQQRLRDPEAVQAQTYHPVVRFGVTSYESKNGTKYKPTCELLEWQGPVAALDAPSETDEDIPLVPRVEHDDAVEGEVEEPKKATKGRTRVRLKE